MSLEQYTKFRRSIYLAFWKITNLGPGNHLSIIISPCATRLTNPAHKIDDITAITIFMTNTTIFTI